LSQQILKEKQSKILQRLLEALAPDFNKLQHKVNEVFEQGRKDGLSDMEIGDLVRSAMKDYYTDRTIQRVLPKTAIHSKHIGKHKSEPDKMSGSEREPIDLSGKITVQDTEEEHNFKKGVGVAITDDSDEIEDDTEEITNDNGEPVRPKDLTISPEDYKLENLDYYDNDLLIRIVKHLDSRDEENTNDIMKFDKQIEVLAKENKFLKEGLAHFKDQNNELRKELEVERSITLEASNLIEKLQQTIADLEGQLKK
jgi:hypothetical protein